MSAPINTAPVAVETPAAQPVENKPLTEKIKINGREVEVSIDELKRAYGLHKAAEGKFQDAAKMRKEAEQIKSVFSQKDINNLLQNGWTVEELEEKAAEFIVKQAQRKSMTPQQLAQYEREREYEKLKAEKDEREKSEKDKLQKDLQTREAKLYQTAFFKEVEEVNKKTWLDMDDPVIISNIINEITVAAQKYEYDMSVAEAAKILEERLEKRGPAKKEYLRKLHKLSKKDIDDNDLEAFLENGGKGVREKSVEAFKKAEAPFAKLKPQTQSTTVEEGPVRDAQYYRNIRMGRSHLNKK
jgi:hypothetical protein